MTTSNANLYAHFKQQFDKAPHRRALQTVDGPCYTFGDIDREAGRLANFLHAQGLRPGDRVSAQVEKSPQALFLYLACLRAGLAYHPLNPAYKAAELEFLLHNAEPALVVCDPSGVAMIQALGGSLAALPVLTLDAAGEGSLIDQSAAFEASHRVAAVIGEDMACLLYSSGTTGVPKGIVLTHHNLLSNAQALLECWRFTPEDVLLHALPIFHVHGLFVATHCVFLSGAELRWLPAFKVDQVLATLAECTCMMGVPTYYTRLLAAPGFNRSLCSNVRLFISGSAPLLSSTFAAFEERSGQRILERYGMTETGMNTSNPLEGQRKPGTVGLPLPGVTLRITAATGDAQDPDGTGERSDSSSGAGQPPELERGHTGRIEVRGANVFPGYWRLPDKTAQDFSHDGFFDTGDQGYIDEDGYLVIVGRAKDMVISGGLNVYPKELELLIDALPGVSESAVIGVPHTDFGEALVAVVVAEVVAVAVADKAAEANVEAPGVLEKPVVQPSESSLKDQLRPLVSAFKLPKRFVLVDALPRNAMGKVQKNRLRERYAKLFVEGSEQAP